MHRIEDFKKEHLANFIFRDEDIDLMLLKDISPGEFVEACMKRDTYTIFSNDTIISFVGSIMLHRGVTYAWQFPIQGFEKYLKDFTRGFREITERYMREKNIHRIQTICPDRPEYMDWMIKGVGFEFEGKLKSYTEDKQDCLQFAKVGL